MTCGEKVEFVGRADWRGARSCKPHEGRLGAAHDYVPDLYRMPGISLLRVGELIGRSRAILHADQCHVSSNHFRSSSAPDLVLADYTGCQE